jgi:hypothetical protein
MEWADVDDSPEGMDNVEHASNMAKHEMGYWKCPSCGRIEGWEELLSKRQDDRGKWIYTDADEALTKYLQMMQSNDVGTAHAGFEAVMQFAHMSGRQSNWFIEGGGSTIDKVRQIGSTNRLENRQFP